MVSPSGSHRADRVVRLPECGKGAPRRGVHPDEKPRLFLGRAKNALLPQKVETGCSRVHFYSAKL